MTTFKPKQGLFQERPYYTGNEIERVCLDETHRRRTPSLRALGNPHRAINRKTICPVNITFFFT
jgi:hypothetical protein